MRAMAALVRDSLGRAANQRANKRPPALIPVRPSVWNNALPRSIGGGDIEDVCSCESAPSHSCTSAPGSRAFHLGAAVGAALAFA